MMTLATKRNLRSVLWLALVLTLVLFLMIALPSTSRADNSTPAATEVATGRPTPTFVPVSWSNRMTAKPKGDPDEGKLWVPPSDVIQQMAKDWADLEKSFLDLPAPLNGQSAWLKYTYMPVTPTPTEMPTPTPIALGTTFRAHVPVKGTVKLDVFGCTRDGSDCFVRVTWGKVLVGVYDRTSKLLETLPSPDVKSRVYNAELRWDGVRWRIWSLDIKDEELTPTPATTSS